MGAGLPRWGRAGRARQAVVVGGTCALLGLWIGLRHATWHVAVEPAQALAGLVSYPAGNPFYLYQVKTWTILHQAAELGLRLGASERLLSLFFSGLAGAVAFAAMGLVVLALSGRPLLAVLVPAFVHLTRGAWTGPTYPLMFVGETHTYGMLGLSVSLLALGLLGLGAVRPAALLLGLAPAVHPALGLWVNVIALAGVLASPAGLRRQVLRAWPYLLAGYLAAAASLALALVEGRGAGAAGAVSDPRYLTAFIEHWDPHRHRFPLLSAPVLTAVVSAGLALLCLRGGFGLPRYARLLARCVLGSALLGGAAASIHWLPPERVPPPLLALMPARFLLFNTLLAVLLLFGLLGRLRKRAWAQTLLAGYAALPLVFRAAPAALRSATIDPWVQAGAVAAAIALLVFALQNAGAKRTGASGGVRPLPAWLCRFALAALLPLTVSTIARRGPGLPPDWRDDPALAAAHREPLLATAGDLHLIQLRARAPVLLDGGGLDGLPYAPGGGPTMDRILREVYGLDLFDPPAAVREERPGAVPPAANRTVWEGRTRAEWGRIRRDWGVTAVLTYPEWRLELPLVVRSGEFALYRIPGAGPDR